MTEELRQGEWAPWKFDLEANRARAAVYVRFPTSAKHAEALVRERIPEGWHFGGVEKVASRGWYRAWAWRKPLQERTDSPKVGCDE